MNDYPISNKSLPEPVRKALPKTPESFLEKHGFPIFFMGFWFALFLLILGMSFANQLEIDKEKYIRQNIKSFSCGELYGFMVHEQNKGFDTVQGGYYYSDLLDLETKQWKSMGCI